MINDITSIQRVYYYKISFVSYSLARLNIEDVRHNKFTIIILSYYNTNM